MYLLYDLRETIMKARFFIATIALAAGALMANDNNVYYGAELHELDEFQTEYGKYEARMKMAATSGTVSSMFLYQNGSEQASAERWVEIDIEVLGQYPDKFQSNIITGKSGAQVQSDAKHQLNPAADQGFHTYGIEWTPNYVRWTVDGVEVRKTVKGQNDSKNQVANLIGPQGLRFNLWISSDPGWVGNLNPNELPRFQYINWIKAYSYTPGTGPNGSDFTLKWTDNFDSFDGSHWGKGNWTFDKNLVDFNPDNIFIKNGMLVLALTKKGEAIPNVSIPQDTEGDLSSNSNNPGMSSSSQGQNNNPGQSSSSQGQNYNPGLSSNSQNQSNYQDPYNNTNPSNAQNQSGYVNDPNGTNNGEPAAIRPARVFKDSPKIRGTVNAKGARVSETNRAHYQVDFNY